MGLLPVLPDAHPHAVIDGIIQHVSVSQLQAFDRCRRLWYFDKILHLPGKVFKGQTVGLEGHARIEAHGDGTGVLGPLELLGVERGYVPPPNALRFWEHHIGDPLRFAGTESSAGLDAGGVPVEGYIDLVDLSTLLSEHTVRLTDWKFKKSIDRYGIKKHEIFDPANEAGIQLIGYAEWARRQFPSARFIEAGHVTFQTQGARDVAACYDKIEVDKLPALWENVCRNIPSLKQVALEKDWSKVTPTFTACDKYGGCAYKDKCFDPLSRLAAAILGGSPALPAIGENMGLLTQAASGTAAVAAPPPVAVPTPSGELVGRGAAITPPDAPPPTIISTPGSKVIVEDHTSDPPPAEIAPGVSGVVPIAPRKRGRPPKSLTPPAAPAAPATAVQSPAPAGGVPSAPAAPASPTATPVAPVTALPAAGVTAGAGGDLPFHDPTPPGVGISIFFGCTPMKVPVLSLSDFVRKVEVDFMQKAQVNLVDLRAATSTDLGFGKWKSYLGAAAAGRVEELPTGAYVVAETDERIVCVAEALAALPGVAVTRGLR